MATTNHMTAHDALLQLLTQAQKDKRITSTDVNALVGEKLSRSATYKAAKQLRKQGYKIISYHGRDGGYKLEENHGLGNR